MRNQVVINGEEINRGKDGYFKKSFVLGRNEKGKQKRAVVKDKSPDIFIKKVYQKEADIARGEIVFNANTTFQKWAAQWLEHYKKDLISNKNYKTYEANLKNHIYPYIGQASLKDIKQFDCQKILNQQAGKSFTHLSKIRMTLFQIFDKAVDNDYIAKNPARSLTLPKYTRGTHRELTDFERKHILEVCKTHRAGLWILIMLYTGLRPSEAIVLNWADIDFKECVVKVNKSLGSNTTKTQSGIRDVPLPKVLLRQLGEEKKQSSTTFIFHQAKDKTKPHTNESMRNMWESFKRALDIHMGAKVYRNQIVKSVVADDLTPYCMRHTCATDYQTAGVPLNIAKVLLGHGDIQVTANIYTHYSQSAQNLTALQLSNYWGEGTERVPKSNEG